MKLAPISPQFVETVCRCHLAGLPQGGGDGGEEAVEAGEGGEVPEQPVVRALLHLHRLLLRHRGEEEAQPLQRLLPRRGLGEGQVSSLWS